MPAARPATIADALDRVTPEFDRLVADCRLGTPYGRPDQWLAEREEHAQRVAAAILAPFRGPVRQVAPPLGRIGTATVF